MFVSKHVILAGLFIIILR